MTPPKVLDQYLDFVASHRAIEGAQVVDFGCGVSTMGELVTQRGGRYVGVEHVTDARATLESRGMRVVANLQEAPRADILTMIEVIEHLEDPAAALAAVRASLNPTGVLFVSTPNSGGLRARLLGDRWEQAENPTHVTLFSRSGLQTLLQRCGLHPIAWQRRVEFDRSLLHPILQTLRLDGAHRVLCRRG